MAGGYMNIFMVLFQAHQEIKTAISDTQKMIECMEDKLNSVSCEALIPNITKINQLFIDHSNTEENEIIPILKEMYDPEIEIAKYLVDEHIYIKKGLNYLVTSLQEQRENLMDLDGDLHSGMEGIFEEIMVHLFEEENGLYPLLQGFLKTTKEKTP